MRQNLLAGFLFITTFNCFAQTWSSLDVGVYNGANSGSIYYVYPSSSEGKIYVAGDFSSAGTSAIATNSLAVWDGITWGEVDNSLDCTTSANMIYNGLVRYNNKVVVSGNFSSPGNMVSWNGTNWSYLCFTSSTAGTTLCANSQIEGLFEYNGDLYAGGRYNYIENVPTNSVWKYNTTSGWVSLGTSNQRKLLGVIQNELYAADANAPNIGTIYKYDGVNWTSIALPYNFLNLNAIEIYNSDLYVGGNVYINTPNGLQKSARIIKWDGVNWTSIWTSATTAQGTYINSLKVFNNELYVGGVFDSIGSIAAMGLAKYNGSTWTNVGDVQYYTTDGSVSNIFIFDNHLYITGSFNKVGQTIAHGIAKFDEQLTGITTNNGNYNLEFYPNPAEDIININSNITNSIIKITNNLGQVVLCESFKSQINIGQLTNGLYFIQLFNENGELLGSKKFVKVKY